MPVKISCFMYLMANLIYVKRCAAVAMCTMSRDKLLVKTVKEVNGTVFWHLYSSFFHTTIKQSKNACKMSIYKKEIYQIIYNQLHNVTLKAICFRWHSDGKLF